METFIRKATAEDVCAILPLWHELMRFHSDLDPRFRLVPDAAIQGEAHLLAELTNPAALLIIAEYRSMVVGYCRASVRQKSTIFEQRAHGFISELHVSPPHRRRGIGQGLFQYVQRWLREQGVHRLELVTLTANETSKAFWRKAGCEPFAECRSLEFSDT